LREKRERLSTGRAAAVVSRAACAACVFLLLAGATCNRQVSEKARKNCIIHLELAQSYMKQNDLVAARMEALLAIEQDPTNADAHYTLAYVFGQLKDWPNALSEVRLAIKHAKHYPEAQNLLGVILIEAGQSDAAMLDEAIEVLTKLTQDFLYPSPHLAYGNLGLAHLKKGEREKALVALKKAVELQPLFCVGYYRMGLAYSELGRYKDALDALKKCVSIEDEWGACKSFQEAFLLKGDIGMKLKTYGPAADDYARCAEINAANAYGIECKKKALDARDAEAAGQGGVGG